ncbi:hypothetical protein ATO10_13349 [Actibacterium atlanticum]|uniref:50S ribosomal protein L35 n=1 Tax=Actibacterium atlanticum TaxID=1461693 RepID=A0A058ZHQ7_9RHOB|nr:hypothetical protein [Actibacterium atlanticum]KCV81169.1 hypothetical protein ATO10_13349 [Actibacterium atlanticum]
MDTDLFLVIGVVLGGLAIPSLLNAYSEGRPPRFAAMLAIAAGALIVLAVTNNPVGYKLEDIPDVFTRVIGRML